MGQHGSARLTVHSRLAIAKRVTEEGWSITEAAVAASVSRQTASKWVHRFLDGGEAGRAGARGAAARCAGATAAATFLLLWERRLAATARLTGTLAGTRTAAGSGRRGSRRRRTRRLRQRGWLRHRRTLRRGVHGASGESQRTGDRPHESFDDNQSHASGLLGFAPAQVEARRRPRSPPWISGTAQWFNANHRCRRSRPSRPPPGRTRAGMTSADQTAGCTPCPGRA